ncbi:hypothetical protein M8C21_003265 [Ambrosia artemisiifolia]|uniref:Secreted protein n=1 Tax=Ambrosia artemisiifolia TaxID=4212 RepID=A0AAD5CHQ5_AMBAR|nr:hypothetical protein M8C21_003265 [Ambrosia artemisiifolia]
MIILLCTFVCVCRIHNEGCYNVACLSIFDNIRVSFFGGFKLLGTCCPVFRDDNMVLLEMINQVGTSFL